MEESTTGSWSSKPGWLTQEVEEAADHHGGASEKGEERWEQWSQGEAQAPSELAREALLAWTGRAKVGQKQ